MAHYIDADCLKAEIERRRLSNRYIDTEGYESELIDIIDSLQQEQPEGLHFTPLNRLIQKIPSGNWNDTVNNYAKKLRDCLIKEGYRKDAEVLQGYISYMNGNNVPMATMDGQEQPPVADASKMEQPEVYLEKDEYSIDDKYIERSLAKVRLEKELAEYLQYWEDDEELGLIFTTDTGVIQIELDDIRDLARHFAEWGAEHARKEK